MADTIREKIIKAVAAKLARVKTASGYATDCGQKVEREILQLKHDADLPAFIVFPGEEAATRANGFVTCLMDLTIEGHVLLAGVNPSVVKERILGDMIRIMTDRESIEDTTKGLADDVAYVAGGGSPVVDAGSPSAGVSTTFKIKYRYKSGDPFSQ